MNSIALYNRPNLTETSKERIVNIIRYICLFLFVYTAYAKSIDHFRFLNGLTRVHLISAYAGFISFLIPILEFLIAILFIVPRTVRLGLISFTVLMVGFTIYIISAMIWEPKLPCHCGGAIEKLSWTQHIWFNLAFILLATVGIWLSNSVKLFKNTKS